MPSVEDLAAFQLREERQNGGVQVRWLSRTDIEPPQHVVTVLDTGSGEAFSLDVRENEAPEDVYFHPFAIRAFRNGGVSAKAERLMEIAADLAAIDQEENETRAREKQIVEARAAAADRLRIPVSYTPVRR